MLDSGLMIELNDNRWKHLKGGYKVEFDPRPALVSLESGEGAAEAWNSLWENLHHQGDVDEASYAVVPHLVQIYRTRRSGGWNVYALVAIIELARGEGANPGIPQWLEDDYPRALRALAELGAKEVIHVDDTETVRAILSVIAIAKGLRTYARLLLKFSESEINELKQHL